MPIGGFFNSRSSTSSATGTSGAQSQTAPASSVNVSGGKKNTQNISLTTINELTDFGAIDAAERITLAGAEANIAGFQAAGDLARAGRDMNRDALYTTEVLGRSAFDSAGEVARAGRDLGRDAFFAAEVLGEGAFGAAAEVSRAGRELGRDALLTSERITEQGFALADSVVYEAGQQMRDANRDAINAVSNTADLAISSGFSFASDLFSRGIAEVGLAAGQAVDAAGNALQEVNRDATERTSRVMLYIAGGVAAAAVLGPIIGARWR